MTLCFTNKVEIYSNLIHLFLLCCHLQCGYRALSNVSAVDDEVQNERTLHHANDATTR